MDRKTLFSIDAAIELAYCCKEDIDSADNLTFSETEEIIREIAYDFACKFADSGDVCWDDMIAPVIEEAKETIRRYNNGQD